MRILITGGAGYIGSHTVHTLLKTNLLTVEKLFVLDNLSTGFHESIPRNVEFIKGDVRDTALLTDLLKKNRIDAVIHFAAKLIVPESVEKPLEYYDNNVNGVISLMSACQKAQVKKVIFSSSGAVYGEPSSPTSKFSESDTPNPINPYGSSKLIGERIIRDCERSFGLKSVCLRYFNVAGAAIDGLTGQRTKHVTHLIDVACQASLGDRDEVAICGTDFPTADGTGVRDYIHVEDLAELHVRALHYLFENNKSEILNCGYGAGYSVREVLTVMQRVSETPFKIRESSRRPGDPSSLVSNCGQIKKLFNWEPKYFDLELMCRSALSWKIKLKNKKSPQ